MSAELKFTDWLKLRFPRGCPTDFDMLDLEMAFRAGESVGATQPQAPQGAVTDAERFDFLCTVDDEITMDFLAECIGSREQLCAFVDELIKEKRLGAAPETPEGKK